MSTERIERQLHTYDRAAQGLRVMTAVLVLLLCAMVAFLAWRLYDAGQSLKRVDCVTQVNGTFFSHLADALGQEPASLDRQAFLNLMKKDAQKLQQINKSCPG